MKTTTRVNYWQWCRPGLLRILLCGCLTFCFLAPGAFSEEDPKSEPPKTGEEKKDEKPEIKIPQPERAPPGNQGNWRENMWPAPTAEDWAKPCLITWQRTWEDAVAVAQEEGKPILICINMDGEIASEHYAGIRYRQPDIAKLYTPYVTVLASVYRHTPRDHDDQGRRILCPRFGSVTCGEHIAIEPGIYEKFCDGRRIAPRHIAVDITNQKEAYDVYYTNDTISVFNAIRDGRQLFPDAKPTIVRGDRPILERVGSRALADRQAVEAAYKDGTPELRKQLLEAAAKHPDAEPLDLLRMAVFGLDSELSKLARAALAKSDSTAATTLISDALRVPMDMSERTALIDALKRIGKDSTLARWLSGVHGGLAAKSDTMRPEEWARAQPRTPVAGLGSGVALDKEAERRAQEAYEKPEDPAVRIEHAEASLAQAMEAPTTYANNQRMARMYAEHHFAEAITAAKDAAHLGAPAWRANTVRALAAYYSGHLPAAYEAAADAVKDMPPGESSWNSMAVVTVFAESRWKAIKKAVKAGEEWPPEWLADLHAAYSVLMRHPLGTDGQVIWHYEFLVWLGAEDRASRVIQEGIKRFDGSRKLHELLRERLLRRRGINGLTRVYAQMAADQSESPLIAAFAGYAHVVAADQHRRRARYKPALEAYATGIGYYEQATSLDERHKPGSDHAIALAHAARARVAYQLDDDELALDEMLKSFERNAASAGTRDEMGINPAETAQMLLARLRKREKSEMAEQLDAALSAIDADLKRPDRGIGGGGR
jgi:hypothetical protein